MPVIVPNAAEVLILTGWLRGEADAYPATLRLYDNDVALSENTVVTDLNESDWLGYDARALTPLLWNVATIQNGRAEAVYDTVAVQFTNLSQSAVTVYGWYLVDGANTDLIMVEAFAGPVIVAPNGVLQVWPVVRLHSEY